METESADYLSFGRHEFGIRFRPDGGFFGLGEETQNIRDRQNVFLAADRLGHRRRHVRDLTLDVQADIVEKFG